MASKLLKIPTPVWPGWGPRLLESDVDLDIADYINDECGFNLHMYWTKIDKEDKKDPRPDGIGLRASRLALNSGLFDRLFNKYKACGSFYKKYGGKYFTVILCCLSFRVGANISDEQREYAWSIHRSAGLFKEGITQFRKALDDYEPGKPYDFEEIGLYDMMELKTKYPSRFPPSRDAGHHAPRFFENGKPTSEAERAKMDREAPMSCSDCGKSEQDLSEGRELLRCGKCRVARYCSKECQTAAESIHKRNCSTPEEQEKLANSKDGPGNFHVMMVPNGIKHVVSPIDPAERQRDQFVRSA